MKPYNPNEFYTPEPASTGEVFSIWILVILMLINCTLLIYLFNFKNNGNFFYIFIALCLTQFILGCCAIGAGRRGSSLRLTGKFALWLSSIPLIGTLLVVGFFVATGGPGWGRPLRIRGRQLHPELREGSDWTRGLQPDPTGLDEATRHALESLWLHDAQKEHASVPAFSRIAWMLAAVGAPAELMEWSHRAALEEIEHTRLCFALAAGYSGRSHTVEPMPDLLLGGLDEKANPLLTLAVESLSDGCQLEDFNADVAAACAEVCQEPVTRTVLELIAREERTHADFSWALLEWLLERSRDTVQPAIEKSLAELNNYPRPTAVGWKKRPMVARADPEQMLKHGRLPDERWRELWDIRLVETRLRVQSLLEQSKELTVVC